MRKTERDNEVPAKKLHSIKQKESSLMFIHFELFVAASILFVVASIEMVFTSLNFIRNKIGPKWVEWVNFSSGIIFTIASIIFLLMPFISRKIHTIENIEKK